MNMSKIEIGFLFHAFFSSLWLLSSSWFLYLKIRGLNLYEIATIDIFFFGTIFICEIPTGIIADKFGRKKSVIISFIGQSLGILVFALAENFFFLIISL